MDILKELNEQAETVCRELLNAKRTAKEDEAARDPLRAAYNKGRAEELEKWLHSVEDMISRIVERREGGK